MKKKKVWIIIIAIWAVLAIIGIIAPENEDNNPETSISITEVSVQDIDDEFDIYYVDELHILKKYCFITVDEYYDSESGYSDISYYVHEGDDPMDQYDLFEEHYLVMFYDNSGEPHLASLSNRDWEFSEKIMHASPESPVTVSATVSASALYESAELCSGDKELNELRTRVLTASSAASGIPYEGIFMIFKSEVQ